jgi:hypothetical protein
MTDRIVKISGDWALGTDGVQWMLLRRHKRPGREDTWDGLSFVRSTVDVLARCMRERAVPAPDQASLLEGLPTSFAKWIGRQQADHRRLLGQS